MSRRDKVGLAVLIALFITFAVVLVVMMKPRGPAKYGFEDNIFVKQRIVNVQKSR